MQSSFYVGLSAQIALQRRLETIANNVANASTAGFRAEEVKFETLLSRVDHDPVAFATAGKTYLSRARRRNRARPTTRSTWPCRATPGSASRRPPARSIRATGACSMTADRRAADAQRPAVLDAGGVADPPRTQRRPAAHRPRRHHHPGQPRRSAPSASSGSTRRAKLQRVENSGVIPDRPATPVLDFTKIGVHAGLHRARQRQSGPGDDQAHHGARAPSRR